MIGMVRKGGLVVSYVLYIRDWIWIWKGAGGEKEDIKGTGKRQDRSDLNCNLHAFGAFNGDLYPGFEGSGSM